MLRTSEYHKLSVVERDLLSKMASEWDHSHDVWLDHKHDYLIHKLTSLGYNIEVIQETNQAQLLRISWKLRGEKF